ncbi:MAG: hypothetical protein ACO3PV_00265, partial [Pseudohongiellaceae bacterium]
MLLLAGGLLLAALAWALRSESGSRQLLQWAMATAVPAGHEVAVQGIAGNLLEGLQLQQLQYARADGTAALTIASIEFAWEPRSLLQRNLTLAALRVEGLQWRSRPAATATPFDASVLERWFAALPLDADLRQVELRDLQIVAGDTRVVVPELRFTALLDRQQLALRALELQAYDTQFSGDLTLQQDLGLQGTLEWQRGVDAAWNGVLDVTGSLQTLQLQHALRAPVTLQSSGRVVSGLVGDDALQLDLRHQLAALDIARWPALALSALELQTSGTPQDLALQLSLQAQYPPFAPLDLRANGTWEDGALRLETGGLRSDELELDLQGNWNAASGALDLQWQLARLDLDRDNLGLAGLQGEGKAALRVRDGRVSGRLVAGPLRGELNAQPLALEAELELQESVPSALALDLRSADNHIAVRGPLQPELGLDWTLEAPVLAQLYPVLDGQVSGAGVLAGSIETPRLQGVVRGRALGFVRGERRISLQDVMLEANAGAANSVLTLQLAGLALQRANTTTTLLEQGRVRIEGAPAAHEMDLQLAAPGGSLDLVVAGSLQEGAWQGRMQRAELASSFGSWAPDAGFGLGWQDNSLRIDRHCWTGGLPTLCLALSGAATGGQQVDVDLRGLPLTWLNRDAAAPGKPAALQELQAAWGLDLPAGLAVQGSASLQASVQDVREWPPASVQAELGLQALELQYAPPLEPGADDGDGPVDLQRYDVAAEPLRVMLAGGVWRATGELSITQLQDAAQAGGKAALQGSLAADLTLDDARRLGGLLRLSFDDLAFVESLVPGLQDSAGRLRGEAALAGTLDEPQLDADLTISEGSFVLPALGIEVSDFGARLQNNRELLSLRASGVSGAGELVLQARLHQPFAAGREFSARLEGS